MTDYEKVAREIRGRHNADPNFWHKAPGSIVPYIADALRTEVQKAVERERLKCEQEAASRCPGCADIKKYGTYRCVACEISQAIRERGKRTT